MPSGGTRPLEATSTALRSPTRAPISPTAAGRLLHGHGEHDEVDAGELDLAHGRGLDRAVERRRRAGSAAFSRSSQQPLGLRGGAAAELHLEPGAREHRRRSRCPSSRAPTTAAVRSGGSPPSHSHWSSTHGQIRSVTSPARNGDGLSTRGKVSGRPQRRCTLHRRMRQPRARVLGAGQRDRHDGRAGLEGEPADAALRLRRASRERMRVPSGKITTALAALEQRQRGLDRLLVRLAAADGKAPEAVEEPADAAGCGTAPAWRRSRSAGRGSSRSTNGSRKLRWLAARITPPSGNVLAAEPAQPEVEPGSPA